MYSSPSSGSLTFEWVVDDQNISKGTYYYQTIEYLNLVEWALSSPYIHILFHEFSNEMSKNKRAYLSAYIIVFFHLECTFDDFCSYLVAYTVFNKKVID